MHRPTVGSQGSVFSDKRGTPVRNSTALSPGPPRAKTRPNWSKVEEFVPQTQLVNLKIAGQPEGGRFATHWTDIVTRWSTILSSEVNLHRVINFMALRGATLVS